MVQIDHMSAAGSLNVTVLVTTVGRAFGNNSNGKYFSCWVISSSL